ncbi:MAG: hypothetical protein MJZ28_10595, partial [Paludibacteraceae bacterium]|nr:hypothetical protein [Paludibacteraceae bacterium]
MVTLKFALKEKLKAVAFALLTLVITSISAEAQTIKSSSVSVCEGDPVQLDVTGLTSAKYQWFVNGKKYKVTLMPHVSIESSELVDDVMKVGVAAYPSTSPAVTLDLTAAANCNSTVCHESATGEYIFGSDFDYKDPSLKCSPVDQNCLVHQFPEGVKFNSGGTVDGNQEFKNLFGELPFNLNAGVENNYLFQNNTQKFSINFNDCPYFKEGPFRLFIRAYAKSKSGKTCNPEFRAIKLNGKYGDQAKEQYLTATIYKDKGNQEVFNYYLKGNSQPMFDAVLQNKGPNAGKPFADSVLYRFDIEVGGYFTRFSGADATIEFEMQQSDCFNLAIDFISFESENVCVTPRVACVGNNVNVTTAGFAYGHQITWEVYNDSTKKWGPIDGIIYKAKEQTNPSTNERVSVNVQAEIPMDTVGVQKYRVSSVYGMDGKDTLKTEVEFTLVGEDCANNACVSVDGPNLNCLLDGDQEIAFKLKDKDILDYYSGTKYYEWEVYGPNGAGLNGAGGGVDCRRDFNDVNPEDARFHGGYKSDRPNDEGINVFFNPYYLNLFGDFSEDNDNKPHKVVVTAKNSGKAELCKVEYEFRIVRDPRMRKFKVTAPKLASTTLCAADLETAIELEVKGGLASGETVMPDPYNGFGYIYTWDGATKKTNAWEATLNVDKVKACAGTDKKYTPTVTVNNLGCKADFKLEFDITSPVAPTIDCPIKSDVVLELGPGITKREFKLPVIDASSYTVACGSATVEVFVDGNPKVMGNTVSLTAGTHPVKYVVTDGCGKTADCTFNVKVIAGVPPTLDCSKIENITRSVEACAANEIIRVPDLSKVTSEDKVTVRFYGYKETKTDPGVDSLNYTQGTIPYIYNVGDTYLLWAFSDSMGNTAYCSQKVIVNDNRPFEVTCKTSLDKNDTINVCDGKTWAEIKAADPAFVAKFPTASYTQCGTDATIEIPSKLSFKKATEAVYAPLNEETLLYNTVYNIRWEFTKKGDNIVNQTQYCYASIVLLDNEAPTVDCEKYANATVLKNYNPAEKEGPAKYMEYASGKKNTTLTGDKAEKAGFVYTLAGKLFYPTAADIEDNCTNPEDVVVSVVIEDSKGVKNTITSQDELDLFQFKTDKGQGEYTIHFTFTDEAGNVAKCEQEILVVESFKPVPECFDNVTLVASAPETCNATYEFTETPQARMDYWEYVKNQWGMPPFSLDGPGGYNSLAGTATSKYVSIYPYKLVKLDGLTEVLVTKNSTPEETVQTRFINNGFWGTTWWDNNANPDKNNKVCLADFTADDKAKIQSAFSNLSIGTHTFRWYFKNNELKEAYCDFVVTVEDKTAPVFDCPADATVETKADASDCSATFDMKVYQPTNVRDCSPASERTFEYEIKKDITVVQPRKAFTYGSSQTETLEVGTYTVTWYVTDNNSNTDDCSFTLTVVDKTKPKITCPSDLTLKSLADCAASYTVEKSKFEFSDNCTGVVLYTWSLDGATPTTIRTEDLSVTIPNLTVGDHTVVWTVADRAANTETCTQNIVVTDDAEFKVTCPASDDVSVQTCAPKLTWAELKSHLNTLDALPTNTTYYDCMTKTTVPSVEKIEYKESSASGYSEVTSSTQFEEKKTYDLLFTYTKKGDHIVQKIAKCSLSVYVGDTTLPIFKCSDMPSLIELNVVTKCDTSYALIPPTAAVSDVCTTDKNDFKWYYTIGDGAEKLWNNSVEKLNVGSAYELTWKVSDKDGNYAKNICTQTIRVRDMRAFDLQCPSDNNITFNWCDYQYWYTSVAGKYSVRDSLLSDPNHWPKAKATGCKDGAATTTMQLDSTVYYSDNAGKTWTLTTDDARFVYNTQYTLMWVYATQLAEFVSPVKDSCKLSFIIKDNENPKADCSKMKNYDVFIKSGACDTTFMLSEPEGVFFDNCGIDRYGFKWQFKNSSSSEELDYTEDNATLTFQPGVYTITWWGLDAEGNRSVPCDQTITVRDSALLKTVCPETGDKIYDIESCSTPSGQNILDSLKAVSYKPKADFDRKCGTAVYPAITETVYAKADGAADTEWKLLTSFPSMDLKGVYDIRWVFTVAQNEYVANLADTCEFKVRIGDVTPPTFTCPADVTVPTAADAEDCSATYELALSALAPNDKCSGTALSNYKFGYFIDGVTADTVYAASSATKFSISLNVRPTAYTIAWVVADKAGNRTECENNVTIIDKTKPVITCPVDTAIKLVTACDSTIQLIAPMVEDNCSGAISFTYKIDSDAAKTYASPVAYKIGLGTTVVTWIATDAAGNVSTECKRKYTVTDNQGLNFVCPTLGDVVIDDCATLTWAEVKTRIPGNQKPTATYLNCAEDRQESIEPVITYVGSDAEVNDADPFDFNTKYNLNYFFEKSGENIETISENCPVTIVVKDTSAPIFKCEDVADVITLDVVNGCDSLYTLIAPKAAVTDACTPSKDDFVFSYAINNGAEKSWSASSKETFQVGKTYTITWSVKDKNDNSARNTCDQSVVVNDKRKIDLDCPAISDITFNWCDIEGGYQWENSAGFSIMDTLLSNANHWPHASAKKCVDGSLSSEVVNLDSTIYLYDGTAWAALTATTKFEYGHDYKIKWEYTKAGEYLTEVKADCEVVFRIKDIKNPKADCSKMKNYDIFIKSTLCDTTFLLHEPVGVFTDNCVNEENGLVWKFDDGSTPEGIIYNTTNANLTFKPGKYTITWWAEDKEGLKSGSCPQTIIVRDSALLKVTCPETDDKIYDIESCSTPSGQNILDSLKAVSYKPKAVFDRKCGTAVYPAITETVYAKADDAAATEWKLLTSFASMDLKGVYDIRWVFTVAQNEYVANLADSCEFKVRIGDVTIPEFTCPTLSEASTEITSTDCMAKMDINLGD